MGRTLEPDEHGKYYTLREDVTDIEKNVWYNYYCAVLRTDEAYYFDWPTLEKSESLEGDGELRNKNTQLKEENERLKGEAQDRTIHSKELHEERQHLRTVNKQMLDALESAEGLIGELKDHGIDNWSGEQKLKDAIKADLDRMLESEKEQIITDTKKTCAEAICKGCPISKSGCDMVGCHFKQAIMEA